MHKRVVIKVGTKVLSKKSGAIDTVYIAGLVEQVVALKKHDVDVVLVTSGAVGSGRSLLRHKGQETVADKQVFAAVGQVRLMQTYAKMFATHGYLCAQVLATKEDFRDRNHYLNMVRCFGNLLRDGIIPIVNENDVVAIKELVFTDNDELAGLIAAQLEADALFILTSVDGVLDGDPSDTRSKVIPTITSETIAALEKGVSSEKTSAGRGGMVTKLAVARKLMNSGIAVHVVQGRRAHVLEDILKGKPVGTAFVPRKKISGIKRRLAYSEGLSTGTLFVNECAAEMLTAKTRAMSLLPVGVTKVAGGFHKGDIIEIRDGRDRKLGFGIAACEAEEARTMAGKKGKRSIVHYDYMFIE